MPLLSYVSLEQEIVVDLCYRNILDADCLVDPGNTFAHYKIDRVFTADEYRSVEKGDLVEEAVEFGLVLFSLVLGGRPAGGAGGRHD